MGMKVRVEIGNEYKEEFDVLNYGSFVYAIDMFIKKYLSHNSRDSGVFIEGWENDKNIIEDAKKR